MITKELRRMLHENIGLELLSAFNYYLHEQADSSTTLGEDVSFSSTQIIFGSENWIS